VKCLVQAEADLDKAAEDGATPLIIAAQSEQLKTVSFLAESRADLKLGTA
jgi:ankyrin repeat protein